MTTSTGSRITTTATVYDGATVVHRDTATHVVTAAEVAAGKYLLETPDRAVGRIARDRHLDQLDACGRFDGLLIDVESS